MNPEVQLIKAQFLLKKKKLTKNALKDSTIQVVHKVNDIKALSLVQPYHQHDNNKIKFSYKIGCSLRLQLYLISFYRR